jgi:hypothetical protein
MVQGGKFVHVYVLPCYFTTLLLCYSVTRLPCLLSAFSQHLLSFCSATRAIISIVGFLLFG